MLKTLTRETADRMVAFACEHDDGTAQPRAYFDDRLGAVIVKSTVYWGKDDAGNDCMVIEHDSVRSVHELRAVLGY